MIPDCVGRSDRRSDGQTESIIAKTALCIASMLTRCQKVEPQITKIRVSPPTNIHLLGIHEKTTCLNATTGQHNYMASYLTK